MMSKLINDVIEKEGYPIIIQMTIRRMLKESVFSASDGNIPDTWPASVWN